MTNILHNGGQGVRHYEAELRPFFWRLKSFIPESNPEGLVGGSTIYFYNYSFFGQLLSSTYYEN